MAEYSKEWVEQENNGMTPEFSIKKAFKKLKEGESKAIICEGFGITKIINVDNVCYVEVGGKIKSFEDVAKEKLEKDDSFTPLWWMIGGIVGVWLISLVAIPYAFSGKNVATGIYDGVSVGTFGDMFGSINALFSGIALAGIIFTIFLQRKELKLQRKELRETRKEFSIQNETLKKQRFENTFFQMLNLHQEIVDKLKYDDIEKRDLLKRAVKVLNDMFKKSFSGYAIVELYDQKTLKEKQEKAKHHLEDGYHKFYFDLFEPILSHYFRNIYHVFKYIYTSDLISEKEKQFYASIARAQLSPDELVLIFYNCLVKGLGKPNFLFLVKEFEIMDNLNGNLIRGAWHEEIFEEELKKVKRPTDWEL